MLTLILVIYILLNVIGAFSGGQEHNVQVEVELHSLGTLNSQFSQEKQNWA